MNNLRICDQTSLLEAADYMHDCGFREKDILYDTEKSVFSIKVKEYAYKGRFIQRKTERVICIYKLSLRSILSCSISKIDEKGFNTVGEDYFNYCEIKEDNLVIIRSTFQEIKLQMRTLDGMLEYEKL